MVFLQLFFGGEKMNYFIFDVDGTILDSMEVWNTLASRYVQSLGMIPQNNLDEIVSNMSLEQSATYLKKHYGTINQKNESFQKY